ncbi:MAG: hypothetical protein V1696_03715 [Candidatus Jorgensenbacteria bacterium]
MKLLAIALILSASLAVFPVPAAAQELPSAESIPQVLTDPLGFIQEKLGINIQRIFPGFTGEMVAPGQIAGGASGIWDSVKAWMQEHLGIDLTHLLRGIIDLVVWVFEFAIKLFKSALDVL